MALIQRVGDSPPWFRDGYELLVRFALATYLDLT